MKHFLNSIAVPSEIPQYLRHYFRTTSSHSTSVTPSIPQKVPQYPEHYSSTSDITFAPPHSTFPPYLRRYFHNISVLPQYLRHYFGTISFNTILSTSKPPQYFKHCFNTASVTSDTTSVPPQSLLW